MPGSDLSTLALLVVDDEPGVRDVASRVLRRLGVLNVQTAASGREALTAIQGQSFDAVICDLQMRDGDGLSLIRGLAAARGPSHIILMSAAGQSALEEAARLADTLELSVVARLEKPVTPSMLAAALGKLVADARGASAGDGGPYPGEMLPLARDSVRHFIHETAAPLMSIRMLTEFLLDDGGLSQSQADDVRKIRQAGEELAALIKGLS